MSKTSATTTPDVLIEELRALLEASGSVIYEVSPDWAELRLLGHAGESRPAPLAYEAWLAQYVPEAERPRVRAAVAEAIATTTGFEIEHQVVRRDGRLGWFVTHSMPIKDAEGRVTKWLGTARDVTERRLAEEAVADRERRLRLALDLAQLGTWHWNLATGAGEIDVRGGEIIGLPHGPIDDIGSAQRGTIHPDDLASVGAQVAAGLSQGGVFTLEYRVVKADGCVHYVDSRALALRDDAGRPVALTGTNRDVTRERTLEAALRASEARHAFLVRVSDAVAPLVDVAEIQGAACRLLSQHLDVDRAFYAEIQMARGLAHVERDDVRGDTPGIAGMHPLAGFGSALERMADGVPFVSDDVAADPHVPEAERAAFQARQVGAVISVPLVKQGVLVASLSVTTVGPRAWTPAEVDVVWEVGQRTWAVLERARAEAAVRDREEQLQEGARRKDEFLAMLAHELRNPLAPIRTGLELIRLGGDNAAAVGRVRALMERQVAHMVRLIDDLLDVSRITSGKIELHRQPTSVSDLVASAIDANRAALDRAGMQLRVSVPEHACIVDVDPTRMAQVLSNLLHNAVKFTPAVGHVDVSARVVGEASDQDAEVIVAVADDGIGIDEAMLPRIFELFVQGDQPSGSSQPGLGIGLALARQLVDLHGGRLEAHSRGRGQGSTFMVRLPLSSRRTADEDAQASPSAPDVRCRAVVIDDNEDAATSMAMLIELQGGEVRIAHDGAAGLLEVQAFDPDVVLLDIGMPRLDGYETCRRIRALPAGARYRVVAVTGWGQEQDKRRAAEAGFDAHLTKPVDPAEMARLLTGIRRKTPDD